MKNKRFAINNYCFAKSLSEVFAALHQLMVFFQQKTHFANYQARMVGFRVTVLSLFDPSVLSEAGIAILHLLRICIG